MIARDALAFVAREGIVLQAARGRVPNLAEFVAGERIRGSWWGHAKGQEIFDAATAVVESGEVLVCGLVGGKVTFVHRRLWPALVRLAARLPPDGLARISEEHTASGRHERRVTPYPEWLPRDVTREAARLSEGEAEKELAPWPWLFDASALERRRGPRKPRLRSSPRPKRADRP